jgi:hypothetical protein
MGTAQEEAMSRTRAKDELLGQLHIALADELLARINSGEASPAELNAAIKFLADNKIEVNKVEGTSIDKLSRLPVFNDEHDSEATAH